MLEHKGIEHKVVNLVPGTHAALLRPLGFRHGTVPALRLDGRRVQGSRAISRALEEAQPEPPLFPADPQERIRVEEAERWGDHILQMAPRRLAGWINRSGLSFFAADHREDTVVIAVEAEQSAGRRSRSRRAASSK
jgi:glutathione S-transferase